MFRTNSSDQGCSNGGNEVDASMVITATGSSSSARYGRLWRRSISVGIFISLKKTTSYPEEEEYPSPTSPCPFTHKTDSNYPQQETSDANVRDFISKACRSLSRKSFRDQEASTPSYVPLPTSPVGHGHGRTPPVQSQYAIDILSGNEDEEEKNEEEPQLKDTVLQIVEGRDLIALKKFGGVEKVASVFGSDLKNGIHGVEGQQLGNNNSNKNDPVHEKEFFHFLLMAIRSYTIYLLLVSAGLTFATEIMEQGLKDGWHDGVAILVAVFILVMIPSAANFRHARKRGKKKETNVKVEVVRGGLNPSISISNLVEGDIVRLKEGSLVPGDGLLVNSDGLKLDDKLNPVDLDKNPFLFSGSKVRQGSGSMLVVLVGDSTVLGKGLRAVDTDPNKKLIEARVEKPNTYIENLSLIVSIIIALVAFIRLLCRKQEGIDGGLPELKGNISVGRLMKMLGELLLKPRGRTTVFVSALTVVVIAIQHGMPFAVTISLCCWNKKVEEIYQAKPRNLSVCATMGIVTAICIDVSGDLVTDSLEVNKFWVGEKEVTKNNFAESEIDPDVNEALGRAIFASFLMPEISVNSAYRSLFSWAESTRSLNVKLVDQQLSVIDRRKVSTNQKVYGVLLENKGYEDNVSHIHWTGAALTVLEMCSHYYDSNGEVHPIRDERHKKVIKDMEDGGLRPVAFACKKTELKEIEEDGLRLLAVAGLKYKIPVEVKSAIKALRDSGVSVLLISEDEHSAVRAIACELGICRPGSQDLAFEGKEFRDMNTEERMKKLDKTSLMGSCLAEDKLLVVQSLQQKHHVTAFFGGTSILDIPGLVQADVAITEEDKCIQKSKESSDIIIRVEDSSSLIKIGRFAYHNIQVFSELQLTVCISGLVISFITTASLDESSITTLQLLWVTWVTCLLGGLMMVMELQSQIVVTPLSPTNRTQPLITKVMWQNIAIRVLCQVSVFLIFQFKGKVLVPTLEKDVENAIIFNSFTLCQIFNQLRAMDIVNRENLLVVLAHYYFMAALGSVLTIQVLVIEFAGSLSDDRKLNGIQWAICLLLAALPWGIHSGLSFLLNSLSTCSCGLLSWESRSWRWRWPLVIPFSMFLLFSLSNFKNQVDSST